MEILEKVLYHRKEERCNALSQSPGENQLDAGYSGPAGRRLPSDGYADAVRSAGGASFAYDVTVVQPVTKLEASKKELRVRAERTASLSTLISVSPKNATNTKLNWTLKNKNGIVLSRTLRYFSISNNVL